MPALLIVESDKQLRKKIATILSEALPDTRIFQAADASETARVMTGERPTVAILNIKLPGSNGLDLTRNIKRSSAKTIVIINSNYDSVEYRQAAAQTGADYFLSKKNNTIKDLIQLIETVIDGRQAGNLNNFRSATGRSKKTS